jgi:hypothetical protein
MKYLMTARFFYSQYKVHMTNINFKGKKYIYILGKNNVAITRNLFEPNNVLTYCTIDLKKTIGKEVRTYKHFEAKTIRRASSKIYLHLFDFFLFIITRVITIVFFPSP